MEIPVKHRSRTVSCLLLAAIGAPAVAQAPSSALAITRTPIHAGPADEGVPYGIWAAGAAYKASFHDGACFVPYLGRDYPRTQSLRWRTTSARLGDLELRTQEPVLTHSAFRAEYDLGGLVEAYDVREDGLEQTFVLAERRGAGDLVIAGGITTGLRPRATDSGHHGIVYVDDLDRPILGYGAATAIDAQGDTLPLVTTVADGTLTLRVPAQWLANATFPVVVDPLLSVFWSEGGVQLEGLDLVREDALDDLWLAMSRWVSASDADLWLRRANDDGSNAIDLFTDLSASWSTTQPSLGLHFASDKTLLAFSRRFITGAQKLRFHVHDRNDAVLQTHVANVGDNTLNAWRPDVATSLSPGAPNALTMVWQSEGPGFPLVDLPDSRVFGSTIDLTGTGTAGAPFVIAADPALDHERPQIGKVVGTNQAYAVVYQQIDSGLVPGGAQPTWGAALRRVTAAGTLSAVTMVNGQLAGFHRMAPRLAGIDEVQVVCWNSASVGLAGPHPTDVVGAEINCRRHAWDGVAFAPTHGLYNISSNADLRVLATGFDVDRTTRSHYGISYRSTVTDQVYFEVLGLGGASLAAATVFTPAANEVTGAGAVAFDDDDDHFVIAFERTQAGGSSAARLVRYAQPSAPAPSLGGIGCSSALLSWNGSQLIGSAHSSVELSGAPSGALMTVAMAMQPLAQPLLGVPYVVNGCWLLVPNTGPDHLGFFPLSFGPQAQWTLPLPEFLPGMTLHFQGFHFDATNSIVSTTQRLSVPIVK